MSTQTQTATETPKTEKAEKAKREKRSWTVRLDGAEGAMLRVTAALRGDGAVSFAVHTVGTGKKRVNSRGATSRHATVEEAQAAQAKLVAAATKMGWVRKERQSGFTAKPDAFAITSLPSPKAGKK